jgi:endoglucanase
MKRLLLSLIIPLLITHPSAEAAPERISVKGRNFVTPDGKTIVFKGVSSSDPSKLHKGGVWNAAYFDAVKSWNSNIIRFPIHPSTWRTLGKDACFAILDEGISLAAAKDMHVILDWHSIGNLHQEKFFKGAEGYPTTSYDTSIEETFNFWREITRRYGKNPTVAFFELFNEPALGQGMGECSWEDWRALMEKLIAEIRAGGGEAIPLVAGFDFAYDLKSVAHSPIRAEGIAYVSHPYPGKIKKPEEWVEKWTRDWGFVAEKHPVILTEIGFQLPGESGGYDPIIGPSEYAEEILDYCAKRGISYTLWCFDTSWVPKLIADWDFTPTRSGAFFKEAMARERQPAAPAVSLNP